MRKKSNDLCREGAALVPISRGCLPRVSEELSEIIGQVAQGKEGMKSAENRAVHHLYYVNALLV